MTCTIPFIKENRVPQQDLLLLNYEVLWDIDLGGSEFCRVKLGKCRKSGRYVAVKIITKTSSNENEKDIMRYLKNKLSNNDNVNGNKNNNRSLYIESSPVDQRLPCNYFPEVINVFEDIDFVYIVMELFIGGELYHLIVRIKNKLSENVLSYIFFQICDAVSILHSIGIVHGDIKAENIMFSEVSRLDSLKIIDFGSSNFIFKKFHLSHNDSLSKNNLNNYLFYFDFWSCGKLLYLLLTGNYLDIDIEECLTNDKVKNIINNSNELKEYSVLVKDLLIKLLSYSLYKKGSLSMKKILKHPWFELYNDFKIYNKYVYPHNELLDILN
ncbi:maternal embryonic leucine zipper kinase [Cryptosporidium ryanae]|uniref:maternal embryonic leucine zipper kinase n=1 Tax=Cryptosporidium ryanae TaxID=515981 RepID=UPI00351A81DC|nr:maternal embryonic leucine zipper kinase [Cryptosporidium ryanae]